MKPILQLRFREVKQSAQKIILLEGILFWEELKKKKLRGRKIARLCKTLKWLQNNVRLFVSSVLSEF